MWVWYGRPRAAAAPASAVSSSTLANRPGAYDSPVVKPRAPWSIASPIRSTIRASSASVGGRFALPTTNRRRLLCPTKVVTLVAGRAFSTASR